MVAQSASVAVAERKETGSNFRCWLLLEVDDKGNLSDLEAESIIDGTVEGTNPEAMSTNSNDNKKIVAMVVSIFSAFKTSMNPNILYILC